MKDSKIGILIIGVIIVLGIVFISINTNTDLISGNNNSNATTKKVVYDGFNTDLLDLSKDKVTYTDLSYENIVNLLINGLGRAEAIDTDSVQDFQVLVLNGDQELSYKASGSFKCNNDSGCAKNEVTGLTECDNPCIELGKDVLSYDAASKTFSFELEYSISKIDDYYSFNEFIIEEKPVEDPETEETIEE